MPFTRVAASAAGAAFTTSTAPTVAYAASPSAGSLLVCTVFTEHGTTTPARTVSSITDTSLNTWALMTFAIGTLSTTQFLDCEVWACARNKSTGANTLTVNLSGAATAGRLYVQEFAITSNLGAQYFFAGGGSTSTITNATSLAVSTNLAMNSGDLLVAICGLANTSALTISNSSSYTNVDQYTSTTANCTTAIFVGAAAGTTNNTCTFTFAAHRYEAAAIAGFNEITRTRLYVPNYAAVNRAMYR